MERTCSNQRGRHQDTSATRASITTPSNRFLNSRRSSALYATRCQALASLANCQNRTERHTTPVSLLRNRVSMSTESAPSATDDPDMGLDVNLGHLRPVEPVPDIRRAAGCVPARRDLRVARISHCAQSPAETCGHFRERRGSGSAAARCAPSRSSRPAPERRLQKRRANPADLVFSAASARNCAACSPFTLRIRQTPCHAETPSTA